MTSGLWLEYKMQGEGEEAREVNGFRLYPVDTIGSKVHMGKTLFLKENLDMK